MGVPTLEVGYTPAMPRREDHEVHKGRGGTGWEKGGGAKKKVSALNKVGTGSQTFFVRYYDELTKGGKKKH